MVVDGVKDLHHPHSLVRANICDYRSHGVKGQPSSPSLEGGLASIIWASALNQT